MGKLTISAAEAILLKLGIKPLTPKKTGDEATQVSRIIFRQDLQKQRDSAIREQELKKIMDSRKVSREEEMKIMSDPL